MVSDTLEIARYADTTVYIVRSNFSNKNLSGFIKECHETNKLPNLNLVLNSVGGSKAYGYKYSYQYGYQYNYKYGYNYGYGYNYSEDQNDQ